MKIKKKKLDYRKKVTGAVICLKGFRVWNDQEECSYGEKHKDRDCCKWYHFDGTCQYEDEIA
jgi:hypothetical protein